MRNLLTSYFYYSRGERNGVLVLAVLSLSLLMLPNIYSLMNKETDSVANFSAFEQEVATFMGQKATDTEGGAFTDQSDEPVLSPFNPNNATKEDLIGLGLSPRVATTFVHFREKGGRFYKKEDLKKIYGIKESDYERLEDYIELDNGGRFSTKSYGRTPQYFTSINEQRPIELKPFDPNTATENELLSLGLEDRTVKVLLKYREKGGRFRTKNDLQKVYNLSDIDFLRISSYIQIAENQTITQGYLASPQNNDLVKKLEFSEPLQVDLNRATVEDLVHLRGIGRTFALRILEHRERLGGFTSLNQLKEVYGLPDSTLNTITPFLRLVSSPQRKIKINTATIEELTHPYLIRKQAEVIVRYRVNHGAFRNMDDIKKVGVLSENVAEKLKPYIVFD